MEKDKAIKSTTNSEWLAGAGIPDNCNAAGVGSVTTNGCLNRCNQKVADLPQITSAGTKMLCERTDRWVCNVNKDPTEAAEGLAAPTNPLGCSLWDYYAAEYKCELTNTETGTPTVTTTHS